MKRRTFLRGAATTAAAAPFLLDSTPVKAATPLKFLAQLPQAAIGDRILIIVQLFGGNDGLNTIVPAEDPQYYAIRPAIAVAKDKAIQFANVYMHPALYAGNNPSLARMLSEGNLAIVQGVGYEDPNLSHFRSTDIWLSGINESDPNNRLESGWVGRFLESKYPDFPNSLPDDPLAIQLGGFSLALMGKNSRMGIEVIDPTKQQGVGTATGVLDDEADGTAYEMEYAFIADIAERSNKYALAVKNAYEVGKPKLKGSYANNSFGRQMSTVASLIAGGLKTNVYVVSLGGFDTHVSQTVEGDVTGLHATLLGQLSNGIAQLMQDMIALEMHDRVLGMTVSEFGRRPQENGSFGTDHGAASVQFVFGTRVNSGVFGFTPDLNNLTENGDLLYQIDYRKVYLEVLTDWFGATEAEGLEILKNPYKQFQDPLTTLDVIEGSPVGVNDPRSVSQLAIRSNYPNPFVNRTMIELDMPTSSHIKLELMSMDGAKIYRAYEGALSAGKHSIPLELTVPAGSYLCVASSEGKTASKMITCVK